MAISKIRIHPALGIARVGNSPTEFFVAPETCDPPPVPPGGYKDADCRIKRQAVRFRLFAYDELDNPMGEITAAHAGITWTVELANRKTAARLEGIATPEEVAQAVVAPGACSVSGPDQTQGFEAAEIKLPSGESASIALGEIRSESDGRLLVLGGFGRSGRVSADYLGWELWYDDVSDGPVKAQVTINATGEVFDALGAWVVVAPPKYAPEIRSVISLYDRLRDFWLTGGTSGPISFYRDIHPILKAAVQIGAVNQNALLHHSGFKSYVADPVNNPLSSATRIFIFNKLKNPAVLLDLDDNTKMPALRNAQLTATQYAIMKRWRDADPEIDMTPPGPIPAEQIPAELDRAALDHSIGASFAPGIEVGNFVKDDISRYLEEFRFDHAHPDMLPGAVTALMDLPWQADFMACGDEWWPVARPNQVVPQGETAYREWTEPIASYDDMVLSWPALGFVLKDTANDAFFEFDRCEADFVSIYLDYPSIDLEVAQGPSGTPVTSSQAIQFQVLCGSDIVLEVSQPPTQPGLSMGSTSVTVPATGLDPANYVTAELLVNYETQAVDDEVEDTIKVQHQASGLEWTIYVYAKTLRERCAVALVLDRSGSMSEDRGDGGGTKIDSLRSAVSVFLQVARSDDAAAIVRFNHNAQLLEGPVALNATPTTRLDLKTLVNGADFDPGGMTSIGDGIETGGNALQLATDYANKAMVIVTDGKENSEKMINDVTLPVPARMFAIGFGGTADVDIAILKAITENSDGEFLLTGNASGNSKLNKYFLQILAGIENLDIVLDPAGVLHAGATHRIPFAITEHDRSLDVILLSARPSTIDFQLTTPVGNRIQASTPGVQYHEADEVSFYRFGLPIELDRQRTDHAGTWHGVLRLKGAPAAGPLTGPQQTAPLPYTLLVHVASNLRFRATLRQRSFEPGADLEIHATLSLCGRPFTLSNRVWAEIAHPDGLPSRIELAQKEPGRFYASYTTSAPGVYTVRVRATGSSQRGGRFEREMHLTGAVAVGADPSIVSLESQRRRRGHARLRESKLPTYKRPNMMATVAVDRR